MMEIEEARERLVEKISPIRDSLMVSARDSFGCIAGGDIKALQPVPAFNRSAMDGYAVFSEDIREACEEHPVRLKVRGEIFAGDCKEIEYEKNTAVRIMTGGMIPDGYDAVVKQEDTDCGEEEVLIKKAVGAFENYCPIGEEVKEGQTVIPEGCRIGRTQAGLIAGLGLTEVRIRKPARIAVVSTGSELVRAGILLKKGKIYNTICSMLEYSIASQGFETAFCSICNDEEKNMVKEIRKAVRGSDLVITTGGVSVGKKDLVPAALDKLGAEVIFKNVNIQPGTPTMASVLENTVIISLSGNPFAALANFDIYFGCCAAKLMGSDAFLPVTEEAVLADAYEKVNSLRRLIRAKKSGNMVYLPADSHKASVFGNMTECNCYIDLPAGKKVSVGDTVNVIRCGVINEIR